MNTVGNIFQLLGKGLNRIQKSAVNPLFRLMQRFFASAYRKAVIVIIFFAALLIFLDYHVFISAKEFNWITVIAQTHGFFFDIVLLGFFLLIIELLREKKRKIQKYKEELEDIFFWNEKEGVLKKAGIIKRLSKLGAKVKQLSGIVLCSADVSNVNLEDAILEGADLSGVKMNNSRLNRVVFTRYAVSSKEDIVLSMETRFTKIDGSELNNTVMCDAECACMDFTGIQMMYSKLNRSNLRSAVFHKTILRFTEMKEALLEDADFLEADLYRAKFQGADLQGALFSRAKNENWDNGFCALLTHTNFEKANLNGAVMNHVDMSHAFFKKASLMNTKLEFARCGWAIFEDALLIDADLRGADMKNAVLKNANLAGANLRNVKNLTLDQLKEVKTLYQTSLDDGIFKEVTKSGFNYLFKWPEEQE